MIPAVVGLDASLASFGVAVIVDGIPPSTHTVRSTGRRGASLESRSGRITALTTEVLDYVPEGALVVLEGPSYASNTAGVWDRGWLWGRIVDRLVGREHPVVLCPPTSRAKYATGRGNAGKDQVLAAVVRRYPEVEVEGNDEADALLLAAMGRRLIGHPIESSLPTLNLKALDGLEVPDLVKAGG